jgi:hypothetical protein
VRVRSHLLVHAGVVSRDDQGIILAGPSGHGKTSLVLELLRRDYGFLSDEVAGLCRADGLVHAFPRSLRIRPATLALAGFPGLSGPEWMGKLLVDIDDIRPGALRAAAHVTHVIVLGDPAPAAPAARPADQQLVLLLDRLDDTLLPAIRQLDGVRAASGQVTAGYGMIELWVTRPMQTLSAVEALCRERDLWILDIAREMSAQPTFDGRPSLVRIPHSVAALELLRNNLLGHDSLLLQDDFARSPTRLLAETARLIAGADCYRLALGPLCRMADLVDGLVP